MTEALPNPAAVRKAEQEIAEFPKYPHLCQQLVEVASRSVGSAPVEETLTPE